MKKFIYSAMAVAMLATTSCKDDFAESFVGEEATVEFSISTPEIATRAYSDGSTATVLQYAIYDGEGKELTALTVDADDNKTLNNGCAKISLQLKNNKDYQIVVWAAAQDAPYSVDLSNKKMTVDYDADKTTCNDETRDAFYAYQEFTVDKNTTIDVKLKRPFAQLNIGAGDFTQSANSGYTPTMSYVKVPAYSTLNFADGTVDGQDVREFKLHEIPVESEDFPYDPDKTDAVKPYRYLAMNYILVDADQELVDIEFGHSNGNEGDTRTIGSVPVQRNYRTNIYGNILTSATDINVQIVPDYTGENNEEAPEYVNVATAQDLIDAVNGAEAPDNLVVTLTGNINLNDLIGPNQAPTRAANNDKTYYVALANGKELTIDLNGCTLTATDKSEKSFALIQNNGTLTIKDGKGTGAIKFSATNNRHWNAYSSVISNQPGGQLKVEGGTIEHQGGTDMAYAIDNLTNGNLGDVRCTINGGTIKSTYRAIRQFLNSASHNNKLTVNGGKIEGANKSIWMQDPSKNANTGELFVAADAELYGNVYLYVTEGSTEWPVEVQIANAALQGESTVVPGNVPAGYSVIEENGVWKVINAVAVSTADDLKTALENGYNAYLSAGEYTFPASSFQAGQTLTCAPSVVFNGTSDLNIKGATVIGAEFSNNGGVAVSGTIYGTFKNCVFEGTETLRWCYTTVGQTSVFENCVVKTTLRGVHFDEMNGDVVFKNCEINGFNAYSGAGTMTFEGCTFGNDASKYNGLNIYTNTVLKDCTFNYESGKTNFIDMEGTGKTLKINNCSATLDGAIANISDFIGGSKLADNTVIIE